MKGLAMAVVGYAFLLRLLYARAVELMPEETYYWNYSRHLDIGYLDHPPMVAWLIRAGTTLFGQTEFGVRFGAVCCGVIAALFIYRLTRNVFGDAGAWAAVLLAQVLPFFFLSGLLMTPDAPLTAAWAASVYFLERALIAGRPGAWLGVGLSMGLGMLSKYTIVMVGAAALLFMLVDPPSRRWLHSWRPYAAVLLAAAVFSPVIVWNAHHDWASFVFQTSRRLADRPQFSLHKLIAGAMVLITPTGLIAVIAAFGRGKPPLMAATGTDTPARGDALLRAWRFFRLVLFVPLAVFALFSLRHEVKLDWTGAPWVAALPVVACTIVISRGASGLSSMHSLRGAWPPTILCLMVFYGAGLYYLVLGIPGVGYSRHTELIPVGWRDFGGQIDAIAADVRSKYGDDVLVVGMDRYAIASELAFYARDQAKSVATTSTGHLFDQVGLMYERWFPAERQAGRTLLLVAWDAESLAAARLEKHVARLEPVLQGEIRYNGRAVRPYFYRLTHGFRADSVAGGASTR